MGVEEGGRFKGLHYSRRNNELNHPRAITSNNSIPQKSARSSPPPKNTWKPNAPSPNVSLNVDLGSVLAKMNVQVPLLELAKLKHQRGQVKKASNLEKESENPPYDPSKHV